MKNVLVGITLLLSAANVGTAAAAPIPAAKVPLLTSDADLIVVGRAANVTVQRGASTFERFSVNVDRVLKDDSAPSAARPQVRLDLSRDDYATVGEHRYGMFFLRRLTGGVYIATDPFHPALPASPTPTAGTRPSADVLGSVASELTRVLATPGAALVDPVSGVHDLVIGSPIFQAGNVYLDAVEAMRTVPYQAAGASLRSVVASSASPGRLWAINCMMAMGSTDQLEALKLQYLTDVTPVLLKPTPETAFAVFMLANAIEGHLKSPKAVPILAALLGSSEVAVRRAAASVLSDIASPDVIEPLAKVGLADPDEDVRYYSILGLAEASGAQVAPTMSAFKESQSSYERFWRSWATTNVR